MLMNQLSLPRTKRLCHIHLGVKQEKSGKKGELLALKILRKFSESPLRAELRRCSHCTCLPWPILGGKHQSKWPLSVLNKNNHQDDQNSRVLELADHNYTPTGLAKMFFEGIDDAECDPENDILLLEAILNTKTDETSNDEPSKVELKDLPPHLEYAFLEGDNKLPVIIAKDLSVGEKAALIKVLQSHKRAIAWKLSDIKGINPEFCTHKILMEEDYTPAVQHQRRETNTIVFSMVSRVIFKYPSTQMIRKRQHLLAHTEPLPTAAIALGSGNAQHIPRCMMAIFHDMIEKTMEVFMDDFSIFGSSFSTCLTHLEKMLKRCEDTNLALNWEKSHFMVKEMLVL
ncbi:reverse transcriptase domain-containing protein [Tanacetum coccineum]